MTGFLREFIYALIYRGDFQCFRGKYSRTAGVIPDRWEKFVLPVAREITGGKNDDRIFQNKKAEAAAPL